jgi:hypothetical protein
MRGSDTDILVPQLIHTRQEDNRAVPYVACVIDEFVLHLHFCVLDPYGDVTVVHVDRALVNTARSA